VIIHTLPSPLPKITELIRNREPVSVITRTHGVWDFFKNMLIFRKTGRHPRPGTSSARLAANYSPSFWNDIVASIKIDNSECNCFDSFSLTNSKISGLKIGHKAYNINQYISAFKDFGIYGAIVSKTWYDAMMFRDAICYSDDFVNFLESFIRSYKIVVVAPGYLRGCLKHINNKVRYISTGYPEHIISNESGYKYLQMLKKKIEQDAKSRRTYTVYLFQAGAASQLLIDHIANLNLGHALIDFGLCLNLFLRNKPCRAKIVPEWYRLRKHCISKTSIKVLSSLLGQEKMEIL